MTKKNLPVLHIEQFDHAHGSFTKNEQDVYANTIAAHVKYHHFIHTPHKHDFFLTMIFTKGSGIHEVDFTSYPVKPGSVFLLSPGQTHNWKLSDDIDGYIFFHSRAFYELPFASEKIQLFPFFQSGQSSPLIRLNTKQTLPVADLFQNILKEFEQNKPLKKECLHTLIHLLYIDLARVCVPTVDAAQPGYLHQLRKLERMIDRNYKTGKSPTVYAKQMHISEKHLNRICKTTVEKTTTELIADRVVLEAKRLLAQTKYSVSEVAGELGYEDVSYFIRFFKKQCGETPAAFASRYR